MNKWSVTSIILVACFVFVLSIELGLIPESMAALIPVEIRGWVLIISLVLLALAGIGIFPMSPKK